MFKDLIGDLAGTEHVPADERAVQDFAEACRRVDTNPREKQRIRDITDLVDAEDALYDQAVAALGRGDHETAVPLLRRAAQKEIGDAAWLLAVALDERGETAEAITWYERAARDGDSRAEAVLRDEQQSGPALAARRDLPEFRILGALQMTAGGQPQETGPEKEQRLLVALLSERGMPVTYERLMEAVWDDMPKRGAPDALQNLVGWLRKRLATMGADGMLTSASGTYRLDIPAAHVDVHRFHDLIARASDPAGDDRRVIALLEEALRLHQGEPLAGLRGRWIGRYRHCLAEKRRAAELALCEAAIRIGESHERLDKLHSLFRDRPRDEWAAWLYMHALYREGRKADALRVWHTATRHLDDPTATASLRALWDLHERILGQDDDLLRPEAVKFPGGEADMRARAVFRADVSATAAVFGIQFDHHKPQ